MTEHRVLHLQRGERRAPGNGPKQPPRDEMHEEEQHWPILRFASMRARNQFCALHATVTRSAVIDSGSHLPLAPAPRSSSDRSIFATVSATESHRRGAGALPRSKLYRSPNCREHSETVQPRLRLLSTLPVRHTLGEAAFYASSWRATAPEPPASCRPLASSQRANARLILRGI